MRHLCTSSGIGGMSLKNRVVMAPMTTNFADERGRVTGRMIDYYTERAKGGAALIIVEPVTVEPAGRRVWNNLCLFDNSYLEGLGRLAAGIKNAGGQACLQLNHGGRECSRKVTGYAPVAPSSLPSPYSGIKRDEEIPRTLTVKEIVKLEEAFALAALRARQAGFDAVEIHGAHGYLVSQFTSPLTNKRTDEYGGDVENRARFFKNIVERCKELVGREFPVIARLNAKDYTAGGLDSDEAARVVKILEGAGADAIHVSVGTHGSVPYMMIPGMHIERGCNREVTAELKKILKVPVICVGRINDPSLAEDIVASGVADFVALGRPLVADPYWPQKAFAGREDIRRCIACNECINQLHKAQTVSCSINPSTGREKEKLSGMQRPPRFKKVWVIGGGPAGMEASRVAARRGCQVTLWEEDQRLGGQLNLAVIPPGRREIENIISYYNAALPPLNVDIKTGQKVTAEMVAQGQPDAVVLAAGALPSQPFFPGTEKGGTVSAWDVLAERTRPGGRCAIIGAGPVGMETAEFLAARGHKVLLFDALSWEELMGEYPRAERVYHEVAVSELEVDFVGPAQIEKIDSSEICYLERGWRKAVMDIDTVITATGSISNSRLAGQLAALGMMVIMAGDCEKPGRIIDAIHSGNNAAMQL